MTIMFIYLEHKEECMKWFEENMDYSFAVQK